MELTNLNKILWDFNRILLSKFGQNSRYVHMNLLSQGDITTLALTLRELSIQMAEKEKMVRMLSMQLAEKEQAVQTFLTQVSEKEQAVQALWVNVAEKEQAKEGLRLQLDQATKNGNVKDGNRQLHSKYQLEDNQTNQDDQGYASIFQKIISIV